MSMAVERALALVQEAVRIGREEGVPVAVAVVDVGGRLVAAARGAGAGFITLKVAQKKAAASVNFGVSTRALLDTVKGDSFLVDAIVSEEDISLIPGGLPIIIDGTLVGALGIAGAHYSQDQAIAERVLIAVTQVR